MKEDYLWDKSGEPDPEIQKLEEILGTLRYQPRPLQLPQDLPTRRNHFPLLAIAASVLLALLAGGVWLRVRTQSESQPSKVNFATTAVDEKTTVAKNEQVQQQKIEQVRKSGLPSPSRHSKHRSVLAKRDREEALAAKQQVMLALRVTTEKLSLVHKKTQNPSNQIRNHHRG